MAEQGRRIKRIQKRSVDEAKPAAVAYRLWDSELKGFGLKVMPKRVGPDGEPLAAVKTYFIWYRVGAGRTATRREFTIGRHGALTPEEARSEAIDALAAIRRGHDPQDARKKSRAEISVAELCDLYLAQGVALKKPATIYTDRRRIDAHIKPLLGRKAISTVTTADVGRFMRDVASGKTAAPIKVTRAQLKARKLSGEKVDLGKIELRRRTDHLARGGKGTATRTVGLLGAIFTFAVKEKLRLDNPVRGVERYKDRHFQRFLTGDELGRLGAALAEANAKGLNKQGLAVIRLLALSGARKAEIEALRWDAVDFDRSCLRLADSKTGAKVVPIGAAALSVLNELPMGENSPFVFPSAAPAPKRCSRGSNEETLEVRTRARKAISDRDPRPYVGTPKVWAVVRKLADLEDVRLHDLRHTYASLAVGGGQSLPIIGAILGHRDVKTTAQYAHLADDPVKAAADRTSNAAEAAMAGKTASVVSIKSAKARA